MEIQPLMFLHVPEEIEEPIPSESFTRNERRDTTDFDTAKPAVHETVAGSPEGGPAQERDFKITQLVISFFSKRKTSLSKQTSRVCLRICLP
ncbi:hypothetical protein JTB14_004218 [Gonioctena quinquepunctata]|nr:hypothetical protein JTB14_004218 [Gonioctena quinquepunctata]